MAIDKSYLPPLLDKLAEAKLTVIRPLGNLNFEVIIALRTRSLLSRTVHLQANPTIENPGKSPEICTSMVTNNASSPIDTRVNNLLSLLNLF